MLQLKNLFCLLDVLRARIVSFLSLNYQMLHVSFKFNIFYINSENTDELGEIQALRKRYGIATVPALFVSEKGSCEGRL